MKINSLSDFLKIEDSILQELSTSQLNDYLLIRMQIIRAVISKVLYQSNIEQLPKYTLVQKITIIINGIIGFYTFIKTFRKRYNIIIFSSSVRLNKEQKKVSNPVHNKFVDKDVLVIEDTFPNFVCFPWQRDYPVINKFFLQAIFNIFGRQKVDKNRIQSVSNLIVNFEKAFDVRLEHEQLICYFIKSAKSYSLRVKLYKFILNSYETRFLLKEEACYLGVDNLSIALACQELNVNYYEYQHGVISKGHDAYQLPETIKKCIVRHMYPQYILTYGDWWNSQVDDFLECVTVGEEEHIHDNLIKKKSVNRKLLVLGDGIDTLKYLELCNNITNMLGKNQINLVFRPHPLERMSPFINDFDCSVSLETDIYNDLYDSDIVISEISTGLFEAIGLVESILVWRSDKSKFTFPEVPFPCFESLNDLTSLLNNCDRLDRSNFFDKEPKIKFRQLIESVLKKSG